MVLILLNKIIAILLLVTFPVLVFAGTPKIKPMNQGEIAPFPGVLINSEAVAQSIAEKEYNSEQCWLRSAHLEQKEKIRCDLLVSTVKVEVYLSTLKMAENLILLSFWIELVQSTCANS